MNAERLLALFDRVADAPDAIPRLRRFVLELAVRGKLVEQDPGDESATEWPALLSVDNAFRYPSLPVSWRRTALGNLVELRYGRGLKAGLRLREGPVPVFGSNGVVGYTAHALSPRPTIIVGRKGSAGALTLCEGPSWTTDVAYYVEPPDFLNIHYLLIALDVLDLPALAKGVKPGLSRADVYSLPLAVPPLVEQGRIAARVQELKALLDRLEAGRVVRENARDRFAGAGFATLAATATNGGTAGRRLEPRVRVVLSATPALTTRADQTEALRRAILDLAVRGRLVEQRSDDDRKNQSALRLNEDAERFDEQAFREHAALAYVPASWTLEPLSRVTSHIVDCPHTTPEWVDCGLLCIRTNQVRAGRLDLSAPSYVSEETYRARVQRLQPQEDDILYVREGGVLGVGCRVPASLRLCMGQRLMLIRANAAVSPRYLELCLNSPCIADFAKMRTTGGAAPRVNMSVVRGYAIPVPPLAEQDRIVAKVDALMTMSDQLEAALKTADTTKQRLLEALIHDALTSDAPLEEAA